MPITRSDRMGTSRIFGNSYKKKSPIQVLITPNAANFGESEENWCFQHVMVNHTNSFINVNTI